MIAYSIIVCGFIVVQAGCRSQLPSDQPSRLHDVYQSQSAGHR
ncbi:hypothetical protein SH501x_000781 [Pirellulaceae bacterium SH501]